MSHLLPLEEVFHKLLLLEHLAYGSKYYCERRLAGSSLDQGDAALDEYWSHVKHTVSSYVIECAVSIRIFQDTVKDPEDQAKLASFDDLACSQFTIGKIICGSFDLSLRETCNKIIHARRAIPQWESGESQNTEFTFWNGDYRLSGTHREKPWELILHIPLWAGAMSVFLDKAEEAELTLYIGQDWY
jgi:hypothetical protein